MDFGSNSTEEQCDFMRVLLYMRVLYRVTYIKITCFWMEQYWELLEVAKQKNWRDKYRLADKEKKEEKKICSFLKNSGYFWLNLRKISK